jgi:hypothetical protein
MTRIVRKHALRKAGHIENVHLSGHNRGTTLKSHVCYAASQQTYWLIHTINALSKNQIHKTAQEPHLVRRHIIENMSLPTIEYCKMSTGSWRTFQAARNKIRQIFQVTKLPSA